MAWYLAMVWYPNASHLPMFVYIGALVLVGVVVLLAVGVSPAVAAGAPAWAVKSVALPTDFSSEDNAICEAEEVCDAYVVTVTNVGSVTSNPGEPVVIKDVLPEGVIAENYYFAEEHEPGVAATSEAECGRVRGQELTEVTCTYGGPVPPEGVVEFRLNVAVRQAAVEAGSVLNRVEVSGGGASVVVSGLPETVSNTVNSLAMVPFGLQDFGAGVLGPEGLPDVQAGDHPATLATTMDYTTFLNKIKPVENEHFPAVAEVKTEVVDLPAGLIGNPTVLGTCEAAGVVGTHLHPGKCPADSQVGYVTVESQGGDSEIIDLYNVPPESGLPAEFGFEFDGTVVMLRPRLLPSSEGYVLSVSVPGVPRSETIKVTGVRVSFFGDPGERDGVGAGSAFFTDPTDCAGGVLSAHVEFDSWVEPSDWVSGDTPMFESGSGGGVTGCGALRFEPAIQVTPETTETDSPSGFEVVVKVPQSPDVAPDLATPDLRDAVVSLPEGVSVSPGGGYGLVGCQASGPEGIEMGSNDVAFDENRVQEGEEEGADGLVHPSAGHCPEASRIGEVEVVTPVLAEALHGHVFVAEPECGGEGQKACTEASATNGELYGLYLEVAGSGVIVKLKGTVSANPVTGRLTTTFKENPQLPFSELKIKLNGGPRAPLATPQGCPTATTTSDFTPWSTPYTPDATPSSSFSVTGCGATTPFVPVFSADSESARAASSSVLTSSVVRGDGEQDVSGVSVTLPPGLVGYLSEVPLCGEPEAADGGCGEGSLLGSATVSAGAGSDPFWEQGRVYLTGPYNGAPFGLSVVVPAKAGPFNLGDVVVRAAININPVTTAVTVTTGPLPQIRDGVPLRVRTINVQVTRPGFVLNPSNCEAQSITGTIAGAQGATAAVSSPFAVEGCKDLAFKPVLTAWTQGHASKQDGASLEVKVSYPSGGEANIRSVKTFLPLQLPSRLTTLQKACTAAVFEANPAKCPAESVVGVANAKTPILPVELSGPAYLVSHGNEKFPNLVVVLQGDGVRVDLTGDTDIKKGITSTTFKTVPDDPVSSFVLYLPEGKYSILGTYLPVKANYNLCGRKLVMPTEITGQNGAVIKQSTQIKVTGCTTKKPAKKKTKAKHATKSAKKSSVTTRKTGGH